MKTLVNHTLLYDKDCPLCNVYTSAFIKGKLLDDNGRTAYCAESLNVLPFVDQEKAANEIALIDNKNNTVIYGIDSLLKVIGHSMPWIERVGNFKLVKFLLKKLYAFISYNRKVIIPSKVDPKSKLQCVPYFNYSYRYSYIVFALLITSMSLFQFSKTLNSIPDSGFLRECFIAVGQIIFQSLFLAKINSKKRLEYIGNLMTISLLGSVILLPIILLNSFISLSEITLLSWFGLTVSFMFYEHIRRIKILGLPKQLSLTWVLYRVFVLLIILNI